MGFSRVANLYLPMLGVGQDTCLQGFFDRYIEVFAPRVPDTLEKFTNGIEMIKFEVEINGDLYEITFEKNSAGELAVSNLIEAE